MALSGGAVRGCLFAQCFRVSGHPLLKSPKIRFHTLRNPHLQTQSNRSFCLLRSNISRALLQLRRFPTSGGPQASRNVPIIPQIAPSTTTSYSLLARLLKSVWPKGKPKIKARVIIALACLIGSKALAVQVPFIFKEAIDWFNQFTNGAINLDNPANVLMTVGASLIIAYGAARGTSALLNELRNAVFAKVASHSIRSISRQIFLHLHKLDLGFHLTRPTGALAKAVDRGTRGMNFVLNALVFNVVPTAVEVSLVTGIMAYKCGPEFAYVTLGCVGCYSAVTILITRWRTKFRVEMNRADNEAGNKAIDSLVNYETVKYFNNELYEANGYDKHLKAYEVANLKTLNSLAFLNFSQSLVTSSCMAALMVMTADGIMKGTMTVGDLVLVNGLLFQLSIPLNFLGSVYREVRQGVIDMQAMFDLLSLVPTVQNSPNAETLMLAPGDATISFEDVFFEYADLNSGVSSGKALLNGLTFNVKAGRKVGIVGGSGSGKSTIVRLIFRFYDAQKGSIKIGGKDVKDLTLESLRDHIGVVPQDCVLFHNTIFYNIKYGDIKATDEEVFAAARMANLHDAILAMPNGYDTIVGERGLKLSGGEKQRVAIARTILKNPPIIVFDEATSSLDSITEQNIMTSLKQATNHLTSIYIAHRLATIADADEILVLNDGVVMERGNHFSLLSNPKSKYAELWNNQHKAAAVEESDTAKAKDAKNDELNKILEELANQKCCDKPCS